MSRASPNTNPGMKTIGHEGPPSAVPAIPEQAAPPDIDRNVPLPTLRQLVAAPTLGAAFLREPWLGLAASDPANVQAMLYHNVAAVATAWTRQAGYFEEIGREARPRLVVSVTCEQGLRPYLADPPHPDLYHNVITTPLGMVSGLSPEQAANVYSSAASALYPESSSVDFHGILTKVCTTLREPVQGENGEAIYLSPTADIIHEALAVLGGARTLPEDGDLKLLSQPHMARQLALVEACMSKSMRVELKPRLTELMHFFGMLIAEGTTALGPGVPQERPLLPPTTIDRGRPVTSVLNVATPASNMSRDLQMILITHTLECIETGTTPWPRPDMLAMSGIENLPVMRLGRVAMQVINRRGRLTLGLSHLPDGLQYIVSRLGFGIGQVDRVLGQQLTAVLPVEEGERLQARATASTVARQAGFAQGQGELYNQFNELFDDGNDSRTSNVLQRVKEVGSTDTVDIGVHDAYSQGELKSIQVRETVTIPSPRAGDMPAARYDLGNGRYLRDFPDPRQEAEDISDELANLRDQEAQTAAAVSAAHGDPDPETGLPAQPGKSKNVPDPYTNRGTAWEDEVLWRYNHRDVTYHDYSFLKFYELMYHQLGHKTMSREQWYARLGMKPPAIVRKSVTGRSKHSPPQNGSK